MRGHLALAGLLLLAACGGGGGSGGNGDGGSGVLYVRASSGDDDNNGTSPNKALRTIQAAVDKVEVGDRIVVGPGLYRGSGADAAANIEGLRGTADAFIELFADSTGALTGDAPAAVVIDAGTQPFAVRVTAAQYVAIDGFTITGSSGSDAAGVHIRRDSRFITLRNCEVTSNAFDGIRVETSSNVLLFNNLVHANQERGIQLGGGSVETQLIHNTVALNGNDGISGSGSGSRDSFLRNNLVYQNGERGIDMRDSATAGYDADYNLVFHRAASTAYGPSTPMGIHDVTLDPLLVSGFRLSQVASGQRDNSPGVDVGDAIEAPLEDALRVRTTKTNRDPDEGVLDVGYHYPGRGIAAATRTPTVGSVTRTPATPTVTPLPALFVRASVGSDSNNGRSPATALKTIQAAVNRIAPGGEIVVGPGVYPEAVSFKAPGGSVRNPIRLLADEQGARTGDAPAPVLLDGRALGRNSPLLIDAAPHIIIDGFQITNAAAPAIQIRTQSTGVEVRNCEIFNSDEDGIRVQDSDEVVLFNNLIYCNQRRGILIGGTVSGCNGTQLINNTVAQNGDRGLFIGTSDTASRNSFLRNNLVQNNGGSEIQVVTQESNSLVGYNTDFNMVFDTTAGAGQYVGASPGANDIVAAAGFVESAVCDPFTPHSNDYRLAQRSAGQATQSRGVDAGDPDTPVAYTVRLREGTTATNASPDTLPVDLGFHFRP